MHLSTKHAAGIIMVRFCRKPNSESILANNADKNDTAKRIDLGVYVNLD